MNFIEDDLDQFNTDVAPGLTEGLDPNRYEVFVKSPSDINEETMFLLSDIIDGKRDINPDSLYNNTSPATPETVDRLMNAVTIIYITEENIPVAVASIIDPTVKSYMGFIPLDIYSLRSAQNLDGRLQLEFLTVSDECESAQDVSQELASQMGALGQPLFAATSVSEGKTNQLLQLFGFKPVSQMEIDGEEEPVVLWLNQLDGSGSEEPTDEVVSST
jgi:hypothetical protein